MERKEKVKNEKSFVADVNEIFKNVENNKFIIKNIKKNVGPEIGKYFENYLINKTDEITNEIVSVGIVPREPKIYKDEKLLSFYYSYIDYKLGNAVIRNKDWHFNLNLDDEKYKKIFKHEIETFNKLNAKKECMLIGNGGDRDHYRFYDEQVKPKYISKIEFFDELKQEKENEMNDFSDVVWSKFKKPKDYHPHKTPQYIRNDYLTYLDNTIDKLDKERHVVYEEQKKIMKYWDNEHDRKELKDEYNSKKKETFELER